jgi:hypothetical protein
MADDKPPATGDNTTGSTDLGDAGKRALQAERDRARTAEAEAKAAREELAKLKADGDASKSELQKLLGKFEEMEKRASEAEQRALRAEVAEAKKLTAAQARRLHGTTRDELMADADDLLASFAPAAGDGKTGETGDGKPAEGDGKPADGKPAEGDGKRSILGRPKENLRPGATPPGEETVDAKKIAADVISNSF